jgi:hypothetical protein
MSICLHTTVSFDLLPENLVTDHAETFARLQTQPTQQQQHRESDMDRFARQIRSFFGDSLQVNAS